MCMYMLSDWDFKHESLLARGEAEQLNTGLQRRAHAQGTKLHCETVLQIPLMEL